MKAKRRKSCSEHGHKTKSWTALRGAQFAPRNAESSILRCRVHHTLSVTTKAAVSLHPVSCYATLLHCHVPSFTSRVIPFYYNHCRVEKQMWPSKYVATCCLHLQEEQDAGIYRLHAATYQNTPTSLAISSSH